MPSHSPRAMPLSLASLSLLISLTSALLTAAHPQLSATDYTNCDRTFSCGAIVNVSFPFSGGDRPSHCGVPELSLTCRNNSITEFTHRSSTFRVLQLDQTRKTLTLSRSDLYNNTCPSVIQNSTLDPAFFSYGGPQNEAVSLFYGCNTTQLPIRLHNLFSCNVSGSNFTDSYYLVGPIPRDPVLRMFTCSAIITVPVLRAVGDQLMEAQLDLGETLMRGFSVNYSVPYEETCSECGKMSGQCGFDPVLHQPVCVCGDRICPFALRLSPKGNSNAAENV